MIVDIKVPASGICERKGVFMQRTNHRVTLKDIADACGVSVNTVSRVLRGDMRLSEETSRKVRDTANELGYIRNNLASSLRKRRSNMIAIIIDDIKNQYYTEIIAQMNELLKAQGYNVIILCTDKEGTSDMEILETALSHYVDGILFFPKTYDQPMVLRSHQANTPVILVGRDLPDMPADSVRCDDFAGGYLAGKILTDYGHRRLLYLAGPLDNGAQPLRQEGILAALRDARIPEENIRIISSVEFLKAVDENRVHELILPVDYTAILSFNDQMAYYAMNCLKSRKIHIPEDVSVIGFDNLTASIPYLMQLSSISCQPEKSLGISATRLLLTRLQNPAIPVRKEILPVELFDGGTVGPAPAESKTPL